MFYGGFFPMFDPMYLVFVLPGLLLALYAQFKVKSAYNKYTKVRNLSGITGAEAARQLLNNVGLYDVRVEGIAGNLTDNYDPRSKVLHLSQTVYGVPSVAALGIVAHEVGHAIQDQSGFWLMRLRGSLVPAASLGSNLGIVLFIIGLFLNFAGLMWIGLAFFALAVLFTLITLPVELDASRRAKQLLATNGMVVGADMGAVNAVLNAAALTYVAALLQAIGQLAYYVFLANGSGRSRD